jgi:transcriptional regulator with XRE-family HTH domain
VKTKPKKTIHRKEYDNLISKLILARKESNLTQKQVGDKLGWRQDYISKLEAKQRRLDILELLDLAKIYNKDINYFITDIK